MYRYIGDQYAYELINGWAFTIATLCSLLFIGAKLKLPNIFTKYFSILISRKSKKAGKIIVVVFSLVELYLTARQILSSSRLNKPFGDMLGTSVNYFGGLFAIVIVMYVLSAIFFVDPLKNSDIQTMILPIFLFIVKVACFCNGCCWGIPWEHGPFNRHPYHQGHQVPVQAIEAFFALAIFVFLLWYRKKAKPGTLLPIYIILYSVTRFPVEFLSAAHKPVAGPFNAYHFLSIIGAVYGLILLFIVIKFGEKISSFFERQHMKLGTKLSVDGPDKMSQNDMDAEDEQLERLEKVKLAREKAKARNKTKTRKK